ncbi:pyruvate carboxylase [Spiromyces aspiralis]|uniref:Pyruvate carboxylase n=1 Tax=Spiromyces aspiralis TaxID=68401 RepID=A0ACC1HZ80_9FUNG|nr:pyruvate carboxylase [Spiromyces aspiralis]
MVYSKPAQTPHHRHHGHGIYGDVSDAAEEELNFDYSKYSFKRLGTPSASHDNLRDLAKLEGQKNYYSVENRFHLPNEEGLKHLQATSDVVAPRFHKLLVANRGEIAMRIIRTAHEVGLKTVAIYAHEDRLSMHRYKADESYEIAPEGKHTPVGAYLAQDDIIAIAKAHNCDIIHPGYGFLSENAEFARKVEEAGIKWVGPTPDIIDRLGDKVKARQIAIECNVPVVPGTKDPISSAAQAEAFVAEHGLPIIIKAAMGGGGRGMRVVRELSELATAFERATSEAKAAFGDGTVFIERFLDKPKHIEVQLLGDGQGGVIHLFERDCSVQRRHQKVVEFGPAVSLPSATRQAILNDAVKIARHVNYRNAGTAEFLVDPQGRHYFIEINPRIQVEHTVTEEITGFDIVSLQLKIARGFSLEGMGLSQDKVSVRGFAIQCRVTTEDPSANFQPDTGKIDVYRSPGGQGVRLDGAAGFTGSIITPHYDSLLVKLTCSGNTFEKARRRTLASLVEFRIRGVKTNMWFLLRLLSHPTFITGDCWTTFIDDTPSLFTPTRFLNRGSKLMAYLGDVIVNGCQIQGKISDPLPNLEEPAIPTLYNDDGLPVDVTTTPPSGWRQVLLREGPKAFAQAVRRHKGALIMDTTWRDAHQSLLATRLRTHDMARIAETTAHALANAFALEMWGGATFDVAMRFLHEDPWDRLATLRKLVPNIPFQMLLRGANAVGYTSYPDNVVYEFCKKARQYGVDVFRVFDSLNYVENLKLGIEAVRAANGVIEATICYTGDVSNPKKHTKYSLEYYLDLVDQLVALDIHILGIKDMAGLLKPQAARLLIGAIRERHPDLPIHVHTHDTAGTGVASMAAAAAAGADIVDVAIDSMSGVTSQPCMGALVAALQGSLIDTGISENSIDCLNSYWEQVRLLYACFDPGVKAADTSVYQHEMPGGQYTNLLFQAQSLGLGSRWNEVKKAYADANKLCGDLVKVTPSSKVVGDFAQFLVSNHLTVEEVIERASELSFPKSVIEFFQGYLGHPVGGFPEPLRSMIIKDAPRIEGRPGASMPPLDFAKLRKELEDTWGHQIRDVDVISAALYPQVFDDYMAQREKFSDLSFLPTPYFISPLQVNQEAQVQLEVGKTLYLKYVATGPLDISTGRREVYFELNGEPRVVNVVDNSIQPEIKTRVKASPNDKSQVAAPMSGSVVEVKVSPGEDVKSGQPVVVLSAMKMELVVNATASGNIGTVDVSVGEQVEAGDLICTIALAPEAK